MPNIKPVSDLRNYNEVLRDVAIGEPVFLTKNGRGRYALIDIKEYERSQATIKLLAHLAEAENASKKDTDWISANEVLNRLGINDEVTD
ncbi:MAG: type II toxin-antitoxin system prevent-host-death family antitoxin [Deferribacteraceae bacterium]|jgi:prevent-host-death family protein|nr:type II toxin-antitoxin system prevent-host-death family antitoxin [Deferribacteraceae bacterium]